MVRIEGLKLAPGQDEQLLRGKAARLLRVPEGDILSLQVLRRAIDAREELHFVYTAAVTLRQEKAVLRRVRDKRVTPYTPEVYRLPGTLAAPETPPVVIGAGPGGLFAALVLARCGLRPIVLERGQDAVTRQRDVEAFWRGGPLNTESNVQFGEGGAGAFSDGKLNTGTRDIRHRWILEQLAACGAPESILVDAKPHVGTDMLHVTLVNLRRQLLDLGAQVRFGHRVTGLRVRGGTLEGLGASSPEGGYVLPARQAVLALGHSARDTFEMLHAAGVRMEQKPFAVGVRIEHRQAGCDAAQYRQYAGHPGLPVSTYKLSCHLPGGRAAYSFCVCPGGEVVAAASEAERVVTNGMSEFARDKENINGGLLVNVTPEDYGGAEDPLAGIAFQRKLESAAYALGGGDYRAPAQRVGDFLAGRPSVGPGRVHPSYRPGVTWTDLRRCLPPFVADTIAGALPLLGQKLRGYDDPDAVLTAVESRSSSPVRIPRDGTCQSSLRGLYPCGEGAGYAGGILSAAADGMHCAEQLCQSIQKESDCL